MKKFVALIVLFALVSDCSKKPVVMAPDPIALLDEVCRIEVRRHGQIPFHSSFTVFGNEAMDAYRKNPGSAEGLWRYFTRQQGVCRGALLQLLFDDHQEMLHKRWQDLISELTDQETIHLLNLVRGHKSFSFAELVFDQLDRGQSSETRRCAASTLEVLPQEKYYQRIRMIALAEQDPTVIIQIILALDIAQHPILNDVLKGLSAHADPTIHQAVLSAWATSGLKDKQALIATYADHSDESVSAMATHLLTQLKDKKKLAWKSDNPIMLIQEAKDLDPDLQQKLKVAILENDLEKVKHCLERGADLNYCRQESKDWYIRRSPFQLAIPRSKPPMLRYLIEQGGDLKKADPGGNQALAILARYGYGEMDGRVAILVEAGADPDLANDGGVTPLMLAVFNNRQTVIRGLLEAGADPDKRDDLGRTPLAIAILLDNKKCMKLLEKK